MAQIMIASRRKSLLRAGEFALNSPEEHLRVGRNRIEWIDVARGIGIILVVYGHVLQGLLAAGLLSRSNPLWLSDYAIYTFHMPLFFVLAGLNVKSSLKKGTGGFLLGKLWTVAYPYFLWSAIQGSIQLHIAALAPGAVNHVRSPLFMETILWRPIAQFWFLYALFICHMIAPFALGRKWMCLLVGGGSLCLSAFGHGQPTSYMLPFYILGILIGDHITRWRPSFQTTLIEVSVCTGLFAAAAHLGRAASAADPASIYSLPATVLGICMVFLFSQAGVYASQRLTRILTTIGGMSMTIYILHGLADSSARLMLRRLGLLHPAEQLLLGLVAGVGLPMAAHLLLDKSNLLTPLGLAPWKKTRNTFSIKVRDGETLTKHSWIG
jgi:fucose 4-O-acetylase-like acetyltransferase